MKIIYKKGDALAGPEFWFAHGCNNRGVMGSGIAKQVKAIHPAAFDFYSWHNSRYTLKLGENIHYPSENKVICNWITQDGFGRDGKKYVSYNAIKKCILKQNRIMTFSEENEVAMPKIGAGLGGGDWNIIEKLLIDNAQFQPVVYEL